MSLLRLASWTFLLPPFRGFPSDAAQLKVSAKNSVAIQLHLPNLI